MPPPTLLILTAISAEAAAIARALGMERPGPDRPTYGEVAGRSVMLHLIGIGARRLPHIELKPPYDVLMAGFAGALDPALAVGDIVHDGLPADWNEPAGGRRGAIHTSDQILAMPADKAELFVRTGALAVDMENAIVRQWTTGRGARFIAIRAISDRADQTLDPAVLGMVDAWGRPRLFALLRALFRQPHLLSQLPRLAVDSKMAARRLGEAVRTSIQQIAPQPEFMPRAVAQPIVPERFP